VRAEWGGWESTLPLTPEDVRAQRFSIARRGYRADEVDAFLAAIADDYEDAIKAIAQAAEEPPGSRVAARVVQAASNSAARLLQEAEDEAAQIRHAAALDVAEMRREAAEAADRIDLAIAMLQRAYDRVSLRTEEVDKRVRMAQDAVARAKATLGRSGNLRVEANPAS
jgi:DivIVA domain-containing protein